MKNIGFENRFLTILLGTILVFGFVANVSTQTKRKKTPAKTTVQKPTPKPSPQKTPLRGAGEDDGNTNINSGTKIIVDQSPKFETPFLERCPKQRSGSEKVTCVGIGGGSDEATPEEVEAIHKTVSRIFYGQRFVMVKLNALTLPNQQDEAKSKGCEFFVQTLYKSPFLKGEGTSVWEKVAGMTVSQLPKAVRDVKVAADTTTKNSKGAVVSKSDSQRQSDADKTSNATDGVMNAAGEVFGKINIFKKSKKFEVTFNFFRLDDIGKPFVSLQRESKIEKNSTDASVANTLYNLMRESTEKMQLIFLNPQEAQKAVEDSDTKKKEKKKKDKN